MAVSAISLFYRLKCELLSWRSTLPRKRKRLSGAGSEARGFWFPIEIRCSDLFPRLLRNICTLVRNKKTARIFARHSIYCSILSSKFSMYQLWQILRSSMYFMYLLTWLYRLRIYWYLFFKFLFLSK